MSSLDNAKCLPLALFHRRRGLVLSEGATEWIQLEVRQIQPHRTDEPPLLSALSGFYPSKLQCYQTVLSVVVADMIYGAFLPWEGG